MSGFLIPNGFNGDIAVSPDRDGLVELVVPANQSLDGRIVAKVYLDRQQVSELVAALTASASVAWNKQWAQENGAAQ